MGGVNEMPLNSLLVGIIDYVLCSPRYQDMLMYLLGIGILPFPDNSY
jgi:hypothetical protein